MNRSRDFETKISKLVGNFQSLAQEMRAQEAVFSIAMWQLRKDALPEASRHRKATSRKVRYCAIERHPPAINKHNFSGDVACGFARQKGHGVGDFRRLPDLPHLRAAHVCAFD